MPLSNAERQARYQHRLKTRMSECVTVQDVVDAARIAYELDATGDELPFDDFLSTKGAFEVWRDLLSFAIEGGEVSQGALGVIEAEADRAIVEKVSRVLLAMSKPPSAA